jgi:AraC family transcriptional regulator of adaptative response/methylated-DNA-[protein]-cysteine methyltransferase
MPQRLPESSSDERVTQQRWAVLRARRPDTTFLYGVVSTGIFCRPGCRSRLPQRRNVRFFDSPGAAVTAGFRACKRCQPHGPTPGLALEEKLLRACRLLERTEPRLSLGAVARAVGISPFHFHRQFKGWSGITPMQYQKAHRMETFKQQLRRGRMVSEAIYDAGFGAPSRAYEQSSRALGMSPGQYRDGGVGTDIAFDVLPTRLGQVLVAATEKGVCAVSIGSGIAELQQGLQKDFPRAHLRRDKQQLAPWLARIKAYIAQPRGGLKVPLALAGTLFQRRVWAELQKIPPGQTRTYQELAREVGRPRAVRAVASACAANKVALIIPCHRIVRKGGALGGYRWGVKRKGALLAAESAPAPMAKR